MGERSRYTPGTFCWTDLTTTDQAAAKTFYAGFFGWEAQDMPVGEGASYSMQRLRGTNVAAISPQPQMQQDAGVPPTWNSYVSVESADRAVQRAKELGGGVHASPFDVMEAGRMAVIQDPQGAFFFAWGRSTYRTRSSQSFKIRRVRCSRSTPASSSPSGPAAPGQHTRLRGLRTA